MLIQAITTEDRAYEVEKDGPSFIRTYIFPNGCLPSHEVIARNISRSTDMHPLGIEDITEHYPETLRRWRSNFNAHTAELEALGYDDGFRRLWNMYLQYCEAGFMERRIAVGQFHYAKPKARETLPNVEPDAREPVDDPAGRSDPFGRAGRRPDRIRPPRRRSPAASPAPAGPGSRHLGSGAGAARTPS
jgi:hypothetical protein